jgi:hypothetical protein
MTNFQRTVNEILPGFIFYGFAFGANMEDIDFDEVYENLASMQVSAEDVVFSTYDCNVDNYFWVIAGSEYIVEENFIELLNLMLNCKVEKDYLLANFSSF